MKYTQPVPDRPELPYYTPPPQKRRGNVAFITLVTSAAAIGVLVWLLRFYVLQPLYSAIRAMILILVCIEFICVVILMRSDNGTRQ